MAYWLMKTEPSAYSLDDLEREGVTHWEGVRNYQARNFMRDDMKVGDAVLVYHSNINPAGIVGLGRIVREAYPDHFAWNRESKYFDERSTPAKPLWFMVDVAFVARFSKMVTLQQIKEDPALVGIMVAKRGSRLSIQPMEEAHFRYISKLGGLSE
ncbi:MAG: EVE domain-containing protein [Deltaproteobacteria bacterium]|nr:EVE domain-containing protein [Deltaproteobacteria bacterium]